MEPPAQKEFEEDIEVNEECGEVDKVVECPVGEGRHGMAASLES